MRLVLAGMMIGGVGAFGCADTLGGALALAAVVMAVVACLVQDHREAELAG